jgi:Flp pilus assembly protein TadG
MKRRSRRGQALVEWALLLPLFFLILMGLLDAGRAIYAYNTVANSARYAARVAMVNQDEPTVLAAAVGKGVGLGLATTDVTCTGCVTGGASATPGDSVAITVTYDYEPATPLIGDIFNPTISSTAVMQIERVNP